MKRAHCDESESPLFRLRLGAVTVELLTGHGALTKEQRSDITSVDVLDATVIPKEFFSDCLQLASVDMSSATKLTKIEMYAFKNCALRDLAVPDSVTSIECNAFSGNKLLTRLRLPAGLKSIPHRMCEDCVSLKSVIFPVELEEIGIYAFDMSDALRGARLPSCLRRIGYCSFSNMVPADSLYPYVSCREEAPVETIHQRYRCITTAFHFEKNPQCALLQMKLCANEAGATEVFNVKIQIVPNAIVITGSIRDEEVKEAE